MFLKKNRETKNSKLNYYYYAKISVKVRNHFQEPGIFGSSLLEKWA